MRTPLLFLALLTLMTSSAMAGQSVINGQISCSPLSMGDYICTIDSARGPIKIGESPINEGNDIGSKLISASMENTPLKLRGEVVLKEDGELILSTKDLSIVQPLSQAQQPSQERLFDSPKIKINYLDAGSPAHLSATLEQEFIIGANGRFMYVTLRDLLDFFLELEKPITLHYKKFAAKDIKGDVTAMLAFDVGHPNEITMTFIHSSPQAMNRQLKNAGITPPSDKLEWFVLQDRTFIKNKGKAWKLDTQAYMHIFKRELVKRNQSRIKSF